MFVGYVSDENFVALPGVEVEFERLEQSSAETESVAVRSKASGAVDADLEPGLWRVTLAKPGFTAKRVELKLPSAEPAQFRLLSDRLYGFMWPKWSRCGETSEYCVHSTREFRLDLWRYGWQKQCVRSLGWCDEHGPRAMAQILPDGDFTQSGVNWNRTGYRLRYQTHAIEAPQTPGLYYLHATTRDGQFCAFPWIVSPPRPTARVAVLSSTITRNAYNAFGGRSNYFNQDGLPGRPIVNARQELGRYTQPDTWPFEVTGAPLSFQRPEPASNIPLDDTITDPIPGRIDSLFLPGEWRLIGWLEREGFRFDLYPDIDLHFDRLPLDSYDVLIIPLHSEYWSPQMYHRVKDWVFDRSGRLLALGGCSMFAEVEFQDDSTMLCRREGEWSLRGESAARLLGVAYSHDGFQTGAPYRVTDGQHWVFSDTGLNTGDLFGHRSLHERCPGGASAHELDKTTADSPHNLQRLAQGANLNGAGAELTLFESPSGGMVCATGSLCWSLSLPIDDQVSQVTRNVLTRFTEGPA